MIKIILKTKKQRVYEYVSSFFKSREVEKCEQNKNTEWFY